MTDIVTEIVIETRRGKRVYTAAFTPLVVDGETAAVAGQRIQEAVERAMSIDWDSMVTL